MKPHRFAGQFATIFEAAIRIAQTEEASAVLVSLDGPTNWQEMKNRSGDVKVIVAADKEEELEGAKEAGLQVVIFDMEESPLYDKLSQALLEAVADEFLEPGARVVTVYSGFEAGEIDCLSIIQMSEHLGRLTVRDLRQLETSVPLDTLQLVVNLALEVGREGREGKPVGTLFVVGDHRKVLGFTHSQGFDPVKGYNRKERNLRSTRVREGIKEIAQMDGAFIVSADATVLAACRYVDAPATDITLSKGLGSRHWAAAAISRATKAISIAVSESNGTVRLFQNGQIVLRIEPFRRPMKWREFDFEPPETV